MKTLKKIIWIGLLSVLIMARFSYAQESSYTPLYIRVPGVINIHSTMGDGKHSVEEIAALAKEKGIKVIVLTDDLLRKWEYGIPPFHNLIKKRMEESSILKVGAKNYFKKVNSAQKKFPYMVILPATEISTFYFWKGNPLKKNMSLYNWNEHISVIGLDERDYKKLPVNSNYSLLPGRWDHLLRLWPIITIFLGIWLARKHGRHIFPYFSYKYAGYAVVCISVIWLVNNLFFPVSKYDQYHGDQGIKPYQDLIDYVDKKKGLSFWAHPGTSYVRNIGGIDVRTPSYCHHTVMAHNYTGFVCLNQNGINMSGPGEEWDEILVEYCEGKRDRPVWGIGGAAYHGYFFQGAFQRIDVVQTIFLMPRLDRESVLESLRNGKMYAKLNKWQNDLLLDRFIVSDSITDKRGYMGDEITCQGNPKLSISVSSSAVADQGMHIQVIRKGEVIKRFKTEETDFTIEFEDEHFRPDEKTYYRLIIISGYNTIISNPIFLRFAGRDVY